MPQYDELEGPDYLCALMLIIVFLGCLYKAWYDSSHDDPLLLFSDIPDGEVKEQDG